MKGIWPARFPTGEVSSGLDLYPEATATFNKGVVLQRDGTDTDAVEAHPLGATVTGIYGISLCGTSAAGEGSNINGTVSVDRVSATKEYAAFVYDVSADGVATVSRAEHFGNRYGLVRVGGYDYVDEEDTTAVLVEITDVKEELNIVIFRFIGTAMDEGTDAT